jgi:hypothetical protein
MPPSGRNGMSLVMATSQLEHVFSLNLRSYFGVAPFPVATNSCQEAEVAEGAHPVVLFTPGYTATSSDYTFLMEDLASRGYVVGAIDHTYEATAVEFPGGRIVRSRVGSHLGGTLLRDCNSLEFALDVRRKDLTFALEELARLNSQRGSPFAGKLDLAAIALAGPADPRSGDARIKRIGGNRHSQEEPA